MPPETEKIDTINEKLMNNNDLFERIGCGAFEGWHV